MFEAWYYVITSYKKPYVGCKALYIRSLVFHVRYGALKSYTVTTKLLTCLELVQYLINISTLRKHMYVHESLIFLQDGF